MIRVHKRLHRQFSALLVGLLILSLFNLSISPTESVEASFGRTAILDNLSLEGLTNSTTSATFPSVSNQVTTLPATTPSPLLTSYVERPATFFRADSDSWNLHLLDGGVSLSREPINLIVYGSPGFDSQMIGQALQEIKVAPRQRAVLPDRLTTFTDDHKWIDYTGKRWNLFPGGIPAIVQDCYKNENWSPTQSDPQSFSYISAIYGTTQCGAVFGPPESLAIGIGAAQPEPEWLMGIKERNHIRVWNYSDKVYRDKTSFLSVSNEENFVVPARCDGPDAQALLRVGGHCLTDMNEARDEAVKDIVTGATAKGWKVKSSYSITTGTFSNSAYDLTGEYTYRNQAPGPYDDLPDTYGFATIPPGGIGYVPERLLNRPPWSADGVVRIICIDPLKSDYCDKKPAQRPMSFTEINPLSGSLVHPGVNTKFRVKIGYSDTDPARFPSVPPRRIKSVEYSLQYTKTGSQVGQVTTTPISAARLVSTEAPDKFVYEANLTIPLDGAVLPPANTQGITLNIKACDDGGTPSVSGDDACWVYHNPNYIIAPVNLLISYGPVTSTNERAASTMGGWLSTTQYNITQLAGEPTAAQLTGQDIVVLMLPPSATNIAAVKTFVTNGGSVLIVGEHAGIDERVAAQSYAQAFGLQLGTDILLANCDVHHQVLVKSALFGVPVDSPVNVAATNSVSDYGGGSSTSILQLRSGLYSTVMRAKTYGQGRVVVGGDLNVWGAACNYPANQTFNTGLFNWLSHRV